MALRSYTHSQLLHLRNSPLVEKPENLPAIEQWLEYVYVDHESREKLRIPHSEAAQSQNTNSTTNKRQPQRQPLGSEASPMGNFGAGARPSLLATRSHGASRSGDDVSLGPPRTVFTSSRNVHRLADNEKNGDGGEEIEGQKSRFFGDKSNRKSLGEKEVDARNRESWTRRGPPVDDEKPDTRWGKRDRDNDGGERRNGYGDKQDSRWGGERRQNGDKQGGWRDREQNKRERDFDGNKAEKEPEWMDDPAPPSAEDDLRTMGMPRNQEQFQRWKEAMSGKKTQAEEPPPEPPISVKESVPKTSAAPLKLDGIAGTPFGGWGDKPLVSTPEGPPASAKSAQPKGKGSRFASMFKESQPKEEAPPMPAETQVQKAANEFANGAAADEAGFNNILQMLKGTSLGQPPTPHEPASPPPKAAPNANANGSVKQKSRFTGFFDQGPKSPERIQSPPGLGATRPRDGDTMPTSRGMPQEGNGMFGGEPQSRAPAEQVRNQPMPMMSPDLMPGSNPNHQRPQSGRMNDIFLEQPPLSRGTSTPDINIQNLLANQRAQRPQGQDKNSEFLLNLLQTKGSSRPPSQPARPDNFPLWLDQPPNMPEPYAPKPRVPPPPGLFEDQLMRNAPPEPQRQEQQQQMPSQHELPQRRQSQRAHPGMPPGFYDEHAMFLQQQQQQQQREQQAAQQRRMYADQQQPQPQPQQPGRRMSGHPQMQMPPGMSMAQQQPQQYAPQGPPQGPPQDNYLQSPTGAGPPPGFNPHMARHPSGLGNIPNIFQAPHQQQQQGRGNEPPPPPGFGAGQGGLQSPPGMPPGMPPGFYGGAGGVLPGFMGMRDGMPVGAGGGRGQQRGFDGGWEGGRGR